MWLGQMLPRSGLFIQLLDVLRCFNYGYEKSHIPALQHHSSAHIKEAQIKHSRPCARKPPPPPPPPTIAPRTPTTLCLLLRRQVIDGGRCRGSIKSVRNFARSRVITVEGQSCANLRLLSLVSFVSLDLWFRFPRPSSSCFGEEEKNLFRSMLVVEDLGILKPELASQ